MQPSPELNNSSRSKLVEALLGCTCLQTKRSREGVVQKLPSEIQRLISGGGNNRQDVEDILRNCLQFPNGLAHLLDVVKREQGERSFSWQKVQDVWWEILSTTASTSAPSLSASSKPASKRRRKSRSKYKYDVFLIHSNFDKASVEGLAVQLDEAGLKPFLDMWHLVPGEPWQEALEDALDQSEICAVFLGPSGLGPWENEEMRDALDERVRNKFRRVIPVLLPGANPKDAKTLPHFLRRLTWVDFRNGIDDNKAFRRLIAGITGQPPGR